MNKLLRKLWDNASSRNIDNIVSMLSHDPDAVLLDCGCGDGETTMKIGMEIFVEAGFKEEKLVDAGYCPLQSVFGGIEPRHAV